MKGSPRRLAFWEDPSVMLYQGDCCEVLQSLPAESIQCVVTSPPFWGLRKYAGEQELIWGGRQDCEHQWGSKLTRKDRGAAKGATAQTGNQLREVSGVSTPQGQFCQLCGCWRGAYGLEPTPEMYVGHTMEMLRAIRRVLRKDGVVFWNIGDSYAGSGSPGGDFRDGKGGDEYLRPYNREGGLLKPKDLCLIPFRVALAAQAHGWWVRSVIIWAKVNPMPESVTDRPTDAFDYILMLTKSATYYWDIEAVREPHSPNSLERIQYPLTGIKKGTNQWAVSAEGWADRFSSSGRNLRNVWTFPTEPFGLEMCRACGRIYEGKQFQDLPGTGSSHGVGEDWQGKDLPRSEEPFKRLCRCGASEWLSHFATFPPALPTRSILAATSEKGSCPKCGKPWVRKTEKTPATMNIRVRDAKRGVAMADEGYRATDEEIAHYGKEKMGHSQSLGWNPQCSCGEEAYPCPCP